MVSNPSFHTGLFEGVGYDRNLTVFTLASLLNISFTFSHFELF